MEVDFSYRYWTNEAVFLHTNITIFLTSTPFTTKDDVIAIVTVKVIAAVFVQMHPSEYTSGIIVSHRMIDEKTN